MRRAVVGAVASLLALSCARPATPRPGPLWVVFTGTVTDSATSQPVRAVTVMLLGGPERAVSGPDGRYHFAACLARGSRVVLSVLLVGHKTEWLPVRVASDTVRVNPRMKHIRLHEDMLRIVDGNDVVFTGMVSDAIARPLPGAVVALGSDSAVAGPDGRYRLVAPAAIGSRKLLRASRGGYYTTARLVPVRWAGTTQADLRLSAVAPGDGC